MPVIFETKGEVSSNALAKLGISGITAPITPEDEATAVAVLEALMYEFEGRDICLGYEFEEVPDTGTEHGMSFSVVDPVSSVLALRLAAYFEIQPSNSLLAQAAAANSTIGRINSQRTLRETQYPMRMGRGSGNTLRHNRWQRFYRKPQQPDLSCDTIYLTEGDINDYDQSWQSYLSSIEDIDTYTIDITSGIRLLSDSTDGTRINYRIEALNPSEHNGVEQIKFRITTTEGRKDERLIDVQVSPSVPR